MKKTLLIVIAAGIGISLFAQQAKFIKNNQFKNIVVPFDKKIMKGDEPMPVSSKSSNTNTNPAFSKSANTATPSPFNTEVIIGNTTYDLQTNGSVQRRIVRHPSATISAAWTLSTSMATGWTDRGTGFNYHNGNTWGTFPTARIETSRTGWPSLDALYGCTPQKDVFICHNTANAVLNMGIDSAVGSPPWSVQVASTGDQIWTRMAVGGANNKSIHNISLAAPSGLNGGPINGVDGAMMYYRSLDCGNSWDISDQMIVGLDSSNYTSMSGDSYAIDAKGDTVVIVYFGDLDDVTLAKSVDNGTTWTIKKIIDIPFKYDPKSTSTTGSPIGISDINGDALADTVSGSDGSGSVVLDQNGMAHVFFGNMRYLDDVAGDDQWSYFPATSGLMYWNESMCAGPVMIADVLDLNGDGQLGIFGNDANTMAKYYTSLTGFPSAGIDANGKLFVSYSMHMENLDNGAQNYRHVYMISSSDGGKTWTFPYHITWFDNFSEYIFASMGKKVDDKVRIVYQRDAEPGLAVRGDMDAIAINDIVYLAVDKDSLPCDSSLVINLSITSTSSDSTCTGSATVTAQGGAGSYQYAWDNANLSTTASISGLCKGNYTVEVKSGNCRRVGIAEICTYNPCGAFTTTFSTASATGPVACNGSASVTPSGGTSPYSYVWSSNANGQTTATITGLCAGNYSVTVTDSVSCKSIKTDSVKVSCPAITASFTTTQPSCGVNDGSVQVTVSGGTTPYKYMWSNGGTTNKIDTVGAGIYYVTITDTAGCVVTKSATLTNPGAPTVTASFTKASNDSTCNGGGTATVTGGTPPYSFLWSNGEFTQSADSLCVGVNSVKVTDSSGCVTVKDGFVGSVTSVALYVSNSNINVFPNPSEGKFAISFSAVEDDEYIVSVINVIGQTVFVKKMNISGNYILNVDLSEMNKGVYFMRILNSSSEQTRKVIIR